MAELCAPGRGIAAGADYWGWDLNVEVGATSHRSILMSSKQSKSERGKSRIENDEVGRQRVVSGSIAILTIVT